MTIKHDSQWTGAITMQLVHSQLSTVITVANRPGSIYQYSNMAPRLLGQTSKFGVVFFVSKSLFAIQGEKKLNKFTI